ncbi:MAG: hypothetical protein NZ898_11830 [Myxococcota bacterium]|nr:hypothetical protein [Myxococcota bacterium]MDW8362772.1 hypothetical protein [Myxococcales bacterium]
MRVVLASASLLACLGALMPRSEAQDRGDPFAPLRAVRPGDVVRVPPRALALIPERHVGRMVRFVDELVAIEPVFDEVATAAGLDVRRAVQLRTREARIPIFVAKTEAVIATLLDARMGASLEIEGLLVERTGRFHLLAATVRTRASTATGR